MSAYRPKAEVAKQGLELPLIDTIGHSLVRRVSPGVLGQDRLGAGLHLYRLGVATGFPEQGGVVLQALGYAWVRRPQSLFPDRQRSLVKRLRLGVPALVNLPDQPASLIGRR